MNLSEIVNKIFKIEKRDNLFNLRVKGHKYWDYMRLHIVQEFEMYCSKKVWRNREWKANSILKRGIAYYRHIISDFWNFLIDYCKCAERYDIIFINTTNRVSIIDDKLVNIYTYPIIKQLSSRYKLLLIDEFQNDITGKYSCDILRIGFLVFLRRLMAKFIRYSDSEKNMFYYIGKIIREEFNVEIDIGAMSYNMYSCLIESYNMYLRIFKRFMPKVVIYAENGSMKGMIDAAHNLGITVIDTQHSTVSKLSTIYNYYDSNINQGYLATPDYIFTFGKFWESEFNIPSRKISVGFPYNEITRKSIINKERESRQKNIIIISMNVEYDKLAKTALKLSDDFPGSTVYYKLRPEEYSIWRKKYPKSLSEKKNIVMIDSNAKSLYEYFSICSYQIGTDSGALYEGLTFGLDTFIIKAGHYYESMKPLYDNGYAFLVSNAQEISEIIKGKKKLENTLDTNDIFMNNSLENIESAIGNIIC